jgi:hypothetical protein
MVLNGLGDVIFGQVIILTPPSFGTPNNNCTGSFTVAWGAVANATSYILQRRVNGGAWTTIYTGPNLSFAQTGLAVGVYEYQIIAVKGSKQSAPVASGAVQVLPQGNVGAPFRLGNQLIQQVRSGCSLTNTVMGTYGCTDPTAANYNSAANIGEGCVWNTTTCNMDSPPFWLETGAKGVVTEHTVTFSLTCPTAGSGILTGAFIISTNNTTTNTILEATYNGSVATVRFTSNDKWHWIFIRITGTQRTA